MIEFRYDRFRPSYFLRQILSSGVAECLLHTATMEIAEEHVWLRPDVKFVRIEPLSL